MNELLVGLAVVWLFSMAYVAYWLVAEKVQIIYNKEPAHMPNIREAFVLMMLSPALVVGYWYSKATRCLGRQQNEPK